MIALRVFIPGLVTKTPNGSHGHWSVGYQRTKRERRLVDRALLTLGRHAIYDPLTVTFTRSFTHELDDDNLSISFKACRDSVAKWLGLPNDRDPRVEWQYAQRKTKRIEAGTEIRIERRDS